MSGGEQTRRLDRRLLDHHFGRLEVILESMRAGKDRAGVATLWDRLDTLHEEIAQVAAELDDPQGIL